MNKEIKRIQWRRFLLPMIIIALLFSVLGFAVGINAFFVPFVKTAFHISTAKSYLVTTATFLAFVVFGVPSGWILKRNGYRISIFYSFLVMAMGIFLIAPAAKWNSFFIFLIALFVNGIGQTLLNTAANPFITLLGPEESAAKRISIMGICNKLSFGVAPVILSMFMDTADVKLEDAFSPFYIIAIVLILFGMLIYFIPLPEVKAVGEEEAGHENEFPDSSNREIKSKESSILQFPHLLLGAFAIFLYVGVENIILVSAVDYAIELDLSSPEKYTSFISFGYLLGYLLGILLIPKIISQLNAFKIFALLGVISSIFVVLFTEATSIYFLVSLGLANSLLWPAIWPLALADLGRYTKSGASIMVMGIAGGGILPPILGYFKDISSYQNAYWMLFPIYVYFLFYAVKGHKLKKQLN